MEQARYNIFNIFYSKVLTVINRKLEEGRDSSTTLQSNINPIIPKATVCLFYQYSILL